MGSLEAKKLIPENATLTGECGILIPAYNEEATLAEIVKVALESKLGPVLVVDDGSIDKSSEIAQKAGVTVLELIPNQGKGGAVYAGAEILQTEVVVLIDADLLGLKAEHLHALAEPVLKGEVDMTRGIFTSGRLLTNTSQKLAPYLNGQRALKRKTLLRLGNLKTSGYGIEILLTRAAKQESWCTRDIPMANVSQVMKEEKRGFWQGFGYRLKMYGEIIRTWMTLGRNS